MNSYGVAEGQRALDLVMNEPGDYRQWMTGLQAMVRAVHQQRHGFSPEIIAFVLACFRAADARINGLLNEREVLDCFTRLNLSKPGEWAQVVVRQACERAELSRQRSGGRSGSGGPGGLLKRQATQLFNAGSILQPASEKAVNAQQVLDILEEELRADKIVQHLFCRFASAGDTGRSARPGGATLSTGERPAGATPIAGTVESTNHERLMKKSEYIQFLREEQGMSQATEHQLEAEWKHAARHAQVSLACGERSTDNRFTGSTGANTGEQLNSRYCLTEAAFRAALLSPHNEAFDPATRSSVHEDMTRPLTDFYINSSTNPCPYCQTTLHDAHPNDERLSCSQVTTPTLKAIRSRPRHRLICTSDSF